MLDDWGSLVHRGWDKVNAAIIAPDRATRAELMSLSVSLFKNALEATKEEFPLEPYLGLAHAYCHLSDIDNDAATSYDHAQVAVTYASQLHKKWEEHSPTSTVTEELMRIKDALGCALRQRYIYQGHENDCFCAIELHRVCVEYKSSSNILKASWNYNLSLALICLFRGSWTAKRIAELVSVFTIAYKALVLSNWSNPLYLVTLCSFRIFITLETRHRSVDCVKDNPDSNVPNLSTPTDVLTVLHNAIIVLGQNWLSAAESMAPSPFVVTMIHLATHTMHLLDIDKVTASGLAQRLREIQQLLFQQPYEFDRRHSPYLLDLLGALVRCRRLGLDCGDTIERLGKLLDQNLPGRTGENNRTEIPVDPERSHFERPRLHYLIGESNFLRVSEQKVDGYRDLDYLPAIIHLRAALKLTPDEHPRQMLYLLNLAFALAGSAQNTGVSNDADLEEFSAWAKLITTLQDVNGTNVGSDIYRGDEFEKLDLLLLSLPLGSLAREIQGALDSFQRRFHEASTKSEQHRSAGVGFASMSMRWAMAIVKENDNVHTEASHSRIEEAVRMWYDLCRCYPDYTSITFGYGAALSIQADHARFLEKDKKAACRIYDSSIAYMRQSFKTDLPSTFPDIQNRQLLADTLVKRHTLNLELNLAVRDDLEQAILLLRLSVDASIREHMPATTTHSIAKSWSNWAVKFQHPSVLEAFRAQVDAFVQLAWVGFDFNDRVKTLQSAGQALAADASTCAIRAGNLELAIEMLEACRNLLFQSAASTWNTPLDLQTSHPELVSRLMTLGPEIRRMSSSYSKASDTDLGSFTMPNDRKNYLAQQLRQLGIEWDQVISDVRAASGYEDFMRTLPFTRLAGIASDRIVVSVITSEEYDCTHALLLIRGEPYVLELPLTTRDASRIFNRFKEILNLRFGRVRPNDVGSDLGYEAEETRMIRLKDLQSDQASLMANVLKDLWTLVMDRVVSFLKEKLGKKTESLPHILINATGFLSSLPLHAAGVYDSDGRSIDHQSVLDRVICSYTPSLSSLRPKPAYPTTSVKVLALGAGENLRHVEGEVKKVAETFGENGDVTSLVGNSIDLDTVKRLLSECQIAHFASHGLQDSSNPLNSRLLFHDQSELTLEELMKLYLPKAKLAVLFACETAQGDMKLTNEALHLVGVMLSIGFSGAIGTLWPMSDSDGIPVCEVFYKALLEGGGSEIDYSRASYALHEAVCAQRDAGVGLIRWASFAHFGQ